MFSFCMYWCKEGCVTVSISLFSVLFALSSAVCIYFMKATRDSSYLWSLQAPPPGD